MITDEQIAELRQAAEKATPGPRMITGYAGWLVLAGKNKNVVVAFTDNGTDCRVAPDDEQEANAKLIALANPSTILALLAERDALLNGLRRIYQETPDSTTANIALAALQGEQV